MESSDILSVTAICISIITLCISANAICVARNIFKRTVTLQTEIFILGAYKDYMDMMYSNANEEQKKNGTTRLLMAIDLYCKYVVNGHLDKKLSDDNLHFYEVCIKAFKDTIKEDKEGYNNIIDYAKKYNISLD